MAAGNTATTARRTARKPREAAVERQAPPAVGTARSAPRRSRRQPAAATVAVAEPARSPRRASARPPAQRSRTPRPTATALSSAPCLDLVSLQALSPEAAREHVERYLHDVMSASDADAFEALRYRWELHLVEIEQLRLVRNVDLDLNIVRKYRSVLKRGGAFPALLGLGGESRDVTRDVLLCDGYHRAAAMRDFGIHYVWMWLATDLWRPAARPLAAARGSRRG